METEPLVVVAVFRARPETAAALLAMLESLVAPTRAEPGCHRYDLYRSIDDPLIFFFDEVWGSESDHRRHLETPHVRRFVEAAPSLLDGGISQSRGTLVTG